MSSVAPPVLDLSEAAAAMALVAAQPEPPFRLTLAHHLDFWRSARSSASPGAGPGGAGVATSVLEPGALSDGGRGLLCLLVETARQSPTLAACARTAGAGPGGEPRVFVELCAGLGRFLPPARVRAEVVRREELLRRFAEWNGAIIGHGGRLEPPAKSAQALARLDFRAVHAQELALSRDQALLEAQRLANELIRSGANLG